jgi:polar amino acid transport system substrate-binding protein
MRPKALGAVKWGLLVLVVAAAAHAQEGPPVFTMGTDTEPDSFSGRWIRLIYEEAFRRMKVPLQIVVLPSPRVSARTDDGTLDGDVLRVHGYALAHPEQLRVEEPVFDVVFSLYSARPGPQVARLEELASSGWRGEYRRGVEICAATLKRWMPHQDVSEIASVEQALRKLMAGRTDLYCENDLAMVTALAGAEFRHVTPPRRVLDIQAPLPLYPYLHRKNAHLAERLAASLRQMKAEGLVQRYRAQAQQELRR